MAPPSGNSDKTWKNLKINDLKALEKVPRRLKDQKEGETRGESFFK